MTPVIVEESIEAYHAQHAVSKTGLAIFADAPERYEYHQRHPKKPTGAMQVGTAAHLLALEPHLFDERYYILPATTPEGKKLIRNTDHKFPGCYNDHVARANGRPILREEDLEDVRGIAAALKHNPASRMLLALPDQPGGSDHLIERSFYWRHKGTGLFLRSRPDDVRLVDDVGLDIKISADSSPEAFARTAVNLYYDLSVALIAEGYEQVTGRKLSEYVFIVVEPKPPHIVSCYTAMSLPFDGKTSFHDVGRDRMEKLLRRFAKCCETNVWPGYVDGIEPIRVPDWTLKQIEAKKEGLVYDTE